MGCYVNPPDTTKEAWLEANASAFMSFAPHKVDPSTGNLPVCLVDNGPFTAAAVAYCQGELDAFADFDGRDKTWFIVPIEALMTVSDVKDYLR